MDITFTTNYYDELNYDKRFNDIAEWISYDDEGVCDFEFYIYVEDTSKGDQLLRVEISYVNDYFIYEEEWR